MARNDDRVCTEMGKCAMATFTGDGYVDFCASRHDRTRAPSEGAGRQPRPIVYPEYHLHGAAFCRSATTSSRSSTAAALRWTARLANTVSSRYGCRARHDATDAAAMWYCDRQHEPATGTE